MSYDRVLPKPAVLYDDSSRQDHRRRNNTLLEHKIMTDKFSKAAEDGDGPRRPSSLFLDEALPSAPLSQHLALRSSLSREDSTTEGPKVPLTRKRVASLGTGISNRDSTEANSPPLGSPKSASSKESVAQFSFILYRQHYQASVVAQNPGLANPEISKIIGEQWRALPNETKKDWKALAEEEKARHQQQYPDYRYQPRRYGRSGHIGSNAAAVAINNTSTGVSVCSRCGGRIMNPPSTPNTPFTPIPLSATASPRLSQAPPRSFQARAMREGTRIPSPVQIPIDQKAAHPRQQRLREDPSCLSPDPKRRRYSPNGSYTPVGSDISPESQYPFSPARGGASLPRPEAILPRGAYPMGPPPRPYRGGQPYPSHDPNLTLPPLQTVSLSPPSNKSIETMVMTIPFINKIKVLAKISPPYVRSPTAGSPEVRGAVVAVEGQDKESVNCMLQYLKEHLQSKDGEYNIRVFHGPDADLYSAKSENVMSDAIVKYLNTICAWHKTSDEIVHFITDPSDSSTPPSSGTEDPTSAASSKSIIPKTAKLRISGLNNDSPTSITTRKSAAASSAATTPISATTSKSASTASTTTLPLPVALVPRYQLSTADAHACANPINDSYAPIEHWQWMASLWRGCVGPDITIYIRGCEKEELNKYGGGTPVEIRLNDARSLVVRKPNDGESEIEEKALRRVGFEVEEFLRK